MNSVVFPIGKTTICNIENNRDTSVIFPILTMYVTGYMIPDNVCDITENILLLQGMWQGIWHLTMYVTFQ